MPQKLSVPSLRRFNLFMGGLHLLQGALMVFLFYSVDRFNAFRLPMQSNFLRFDETTMRLVTDTRLVWSVPFALCVSAFLFLSAIAHFVISAPGTNGVYNRGLTQNINPFRWYEYALSSSVMIVLIAMLLGMYDVGALLLLFALNAAMNLFGLLMEMLNQKREKTSWIAFWFGTFAGLVPWVVVFLYAFGNSDLSRVPWFVYAIFGSYFVFFNLFPVNMVLQYKKIGRWRDYLYGERGYIVLSLVAKSVLAWLAFAGAMQPA
ncbi:MAG TPA: heliorhodopsin HeR [Candidatus Limnocylindria bacterium]|nr:heliorhodopsin HeR [Candidatus Limnocylindria bacterium]